MKWKRDQWEESQAGLRDNPKSHQIWEKGNMGRNREFRGMEEEAERALWQGERRI